MTRHLGKRPIRVFSLIYNFQDVPIHHKICRSFRPTSRLSPNFCRLSGRPDWTDPVLIIIQNLVGIAAVVLIIRRFE